jgi:hypothetical protein
MHGLRILPLQTIVQPHQLCTNYTKYTISAIFHLAPTQESSSFVQDFDAHPKVKAMQE